jgi:hypothetical protein
VIIEDGEGLPTLRREHLSAFCHKYILSIESEGGVLS